MHVFDWPADGKLVVPATVTKGKAGARFLAENDRARLDVRALDSAIEISVPPQAPDPIATVIRLDGAFAAVTPR